MSDLTKDEWATAIALATRDMEAAILNQRKVIREAVEGGLPYSRAAEAAGKTKGWVAYVVKGGA